MTDRNMLMSPKLWAAIDFMIGGWDLRDALVHFMNGVMLWGTVMLFLGVMIIIVCIFLMSTTLEEV